MIIPNQHMGGKNSRNHQLRLYHVIKILVRPGKYRMSQSKDIWRAMDERVRGELIGEENLVINGEGQRTVYFITWPVQNVTGQLLLFSLTEVGQHLFEANINGAGYNLKCKMSHFDVKVVNHSSRELLGRMNILMTQNFLVSYLHQSYLFIFKVNFSLKNIRRYKN